jgi:methionine synthase II (cobalamin-independent)
MKITKQQLQQVIKEEITNVLNEEYSQDMEVLFDTIMDYASKMRAPKELMDDLLAMRLRYGGMKPSDEPVGDIDMSGYDI